MGIVSFNYAILLQILDVAGDQSMVYIIHVILIFIQIFKGCAAAFFWYRSTVVYEPCKPNYSHYAENQDGSVALDKQSFLLTRPFREPVNAELFETLSKQSTMNRWGALLTGVSAVFSALSALC